MRKNKYLPALGLPKWSLRGVSCPVCMVSLAVERLNVISKVYSEIRWVTGSSSHLTIGGDLVPISRVEKALEVERRRAEEVLFLADQASSVITLEVLVWEGYSRMNAADLLRRLRREADERDFKRYWYGKLQKKVVKELATLCRDL